jgi:hypothetical protein
LSDWRQESAEERAEYERWKKRKIQRAPHSMTMKLLNWHYCSRCGILNLKNEATRKALKEGCER